MKSKAFSFLIFISVSAFAQKSITAGDTISARFALIGDVVSSYQFSGPTGSVLEGTADSSSSAPCAASAVFRKVRRQNKEQIEVRCTLKCTAKQQPAEKQQQYLTLQPPAFFIDEQAATTSVVFTNLSAEFKKISVTVSDLKISKKQAK